METELSVQKTRQHQIRREVSSDSFSETNGIADGAVRRVEEWKKGLRLCWSNQDEMNNGGGKLWNAIVICETFNMTASEV